MQRNAFACCRAATGRAYRYLILNRQARSSLLAGRATWVHRPLDAARMDRAAQALLGTHDFSSYRALACQAKSPVRRIHRLEVADPVERLAVELDEAIAVRGGGGRGGGCTANPGLQMARYAFESNVSTVNRVIMMQKDCLYRYF